MASLVLTTLSANAAIISTSVTNGSSQSFYDGNISNSDLIDLNSATLDTFNASTPAHSNFATDGAHNGTGTNNSGLAYWPTAGSVTLTYTLTGSATGYDITSINTIYGWSDGRWKHSEQNYVINISTVTTPAFTHLYSVNYDPYSNGDENEGSTQVTLTDDSTGILASGVTGIQFIVSRDLSNGQNEVGVIREYDVFGVTTIPEPSSLVLLSLAMIGVVGIRSRRARERI
ncbi:PEP-CTERM sorting domain-containing protein [Kiritimatiellota bacterium B12222]|nr:PEP-CTERM sorting domain-containing protein [Kiritimatiellota bacterium B12222]